MYVFIRMKVLAGKELQQNTNRIKLRPFFFKAHTHRKDKHLFIVSTAAARYGRALEKPNTISHDFDVRSTAENYVIHVIA